MQLLGGNLSITYSDCSCGNRTHGCFPIPVSRCRLASHGAEVGLGNVVTLIASLKEQVVENNQAVATRLDGVSAKLSDMNEQLRCVQGD